MMISTQCPAVHSAHVNSKNHQLLNSSQYNQGNCAGKYR